MSVATACWYPGDIRSVTELISRERAAAARELAFQHELEGLGEPDQDESLLTVPAEVIHVDR